MRNPPRTSSLAEREDSSARGAEAKPLPTCQPDGASASLAAAGQRAVVALGMSLVLGAAPCAFAEEAAAEQPQAEAPLAGDAAPDVSGAGGSSDGGAASTAPGLQEGPQGQAAPEQDEASEAEGDAAQAGLANPEPDSQQGAGADGVGASAGSGGTGAADSAGAAADGAGDGVSGQAGLATSEEPSDPAGAAADGPQGAAFGKSQAGASEGGLSAAGAQGGDGQAAASAADAAGNAGKAGQAGQASASDGAPAAEQLEPDAAPDAAEGAKAAADEAAGADLSAESAAAAKAERESEPAADLKDTAPSAAEQAVLAAADAAPAAALAAPGADLAYDPGAGTVEISAHGMSCETGIEFVSARLVSPDGSVRWVRLDGDEETGEYSAMVAASSLGWASGTYAVGLSICDKAWAGVDAGSFSCRLDFGTASASPALSYEAAAGTVTVKAEGVSCTSGVAFVSARVTSPAGAVRWLRLDADPAQDGAYLARVPASDFGWASGAYAVELTVCDDAWRGVPAGSGTCMLSFGTAQARPALSLDTASGMLSVKAEGVSCTSGVAFVSARVTSPTGAVAWLRLDADGTGGYSSQVAASSLGTSSGVFQVDLTVCDDAWRGIPAGGAPVALRASGRADSVRAEGDVVARNLVLTASGDTVSQASNVAFMVQTYTGAITWHQARQLDDGSWTCSIGASQLDMGSGWAQAVATASGTTSYLASAPFSVADAQPGLTRLSASVGDAEGGSAEVQSAFVDDTIYLFLPSNADPSAVDVATLSGLSQAAVLVSSEPTAGFELVRTGEAIDLTDGYKAGDNTYIVYLKTQLDQAATQLCVLQSSGQKSMHITSDDPVNRGRAYVEGSPDHSAKATGSMLLVDADGQVVYNGGLKQIKGRGNSTWALDKKPYQIKLSSSASLITQDKANKSKTWVLLANGYDPTLMRNYITYKLAAGLGLSATPDCESVDLYYDGEYRGTYLLSEKVEIGKGRVEVADLEDENGSADGADLEDHATATGWNRYGQPYQYVEGVAQPGDISGGYLIELDNGYYDEERSWFGTSDGVFVLKSPENASQGEVRYIGEAMQHAINVAKRDAGGLSQVLDLDSLASTFLVQCFAKNPDYIQYSSTYFYKDAGNDVIYSGPVWDFDLAYRNHDTWESFTPSPEDFGQEQRAFFFNNSEFRSAVKQKYDSAFKPLVQSTLLSGDGGTDELGSIDAVAEGLASSAAMNSKVWGYRSGSDQYPAAGTFAENVSQLKSWIQRRAAWLDSEMGSGRW